MSFSKVDIYNMALSHLGVGSEVASTTEQSEEARACNRFYDVARQQTLRSSPWPFATKIAALGLVQEDPNEEWAYSYQYPSDCLRVRRILSGIRNDAPENRIPYRIAYGTAGAVLFTDREEAEIEYTVDVTEENRFSADFVNMLSLLLAAFIAPRVTGGDPFRKGRECEQKFVAFAALSEANAINEEQSEIPPESSFIRGRE